MLLWFLATVVAKPPVSGAAPWGLPTERPPWIADDDPWTECVNVIGQGNPTGRFYEQSLKGGLGVTCRERERHNQVCVTANGPLPGRWPKITCELGGETIRYAPYPAYAPIVDPEGVNVIVWPSGHLGMLTLVVPPGHWAGPEYRLPREERAFVWSCGLATPIQGFRTLAITVPADRGTFRCDLMHDGQPVSLLFDLRDL